MVQSAGSLLGGTRRKVLVVGPPSERFWQGLEPIAAEAEILAIAEDEATLARHVAGAEVIFMWANVPLLAALWPRVRALRWVHAGWAGVDKLLFPELVASDVVLTRSAGIYGSSLAEYALAAMLFFAKRLPELLANQRARAWRKVSPSDLRGKTLGIVGLGDVGLALAAKAKALGMHVVGLRRTGGAAPPFVDRVLPPAGLSELLAAADYVVLCTPLTPQTRGLIGERELGLLQPGAVLVNIARGGIVCEEALLAALHSGRLAGAAVDVFANEPLPPDSPFYDAPNVLISPHSMDTVPGWEDRVVGLFVENFRRYVAGRPLLHVVDKRRGY